MLQEHRYTPQYMYMIFELTFTVTSMLDFHLVQGKGSTCPWRFAAPYIRAFLHFHSRPFFSSSNTTTSRPLDRHYDVFWRASNRARPAHPVLDEAGLHNISQAFKYLRTLAEPLLYRNLAFKDKEDVAVRLLLLTLLERPDLAGHIACFSLSGVSIDDDRYHTHSFNERI